MTIALQQASMWWKSAVDKQPKIKQAIAIPTAISNALQPSIGHPPAIPPENPPSYDIPPGSAKIALGDLSRCALRSNLNYRAL